LAVLALVIALGFRDRGVSTEEGPLPPAPVVLEDVPVPAVPVVFPETDPPVAVEEDPLDNLSASAPSEATAPPKPVVKPTPPAAKSPPVEVPESKPPQQPPMAVAPFDAAAAKRHQQAWADFLGQSVEVTNSIGMKLILIPPGEFLMGSPVSEAERSSDEKQHRVRITKPYYLGIFEVTQSEYERVMGTNPSWFSLSGSGRGDVVKQEPNRFPVETVSWEDAVEFCRELSALPEERAAGRVYRLPTEAEWEFACRAGTAMPFHFGSQLNGQEANCDGSYPYGTTKGPCLQRPTTVGSYASNGFGLFDMHGNVWEWCWDWYGAYATTVDDPTGPQAGPVRVLRGGSWFYGGSYCRSAYRLHYGPPARCSYVGFRLVSR
jgi:formylglycine-generating enzyme required for sulfatase activity